MMKKLYLQFGLLIIISQQIFAQVGIGTTDPQATMDTNGTVRITQITPVTDNNIKLSGVTTSEILNQTGLGANLHITNNELTTVPVSRSIGEFDLGAVPIDFLGNISGLDLEIGSGESNTFSTFIRVHSYVTVANITGIIGGTQGRRLTLFFSEATNMRIKEESSYEPPTNRIVTLATSHLTVSGMGFVDLIYDETAGSDGLGRWLVIKFNG